MWPPPRSAASNGLWRLHWLSTVRESTQAGFHSLCLVFLWQSPSFPLDGAKVFSVNSDSDCLKRRRHQDVRNTLLYFPIHFSIQTVENVGLRGQPRFRLCTIPIYNEFYTGSNPLEGETSSFHLIFCCLVDRVGFNDRYGCQKPI